MQGSNETSAAERVKNNVENDLIGDGKSEYTSVLMLSSRTTRRLEGNSFDKETIAKILSYEKQ